MKLTVAALPMILAAMLLFPVAGSADQSDQRLDELFQTLRSSQDATELSDTEAAIWDIWYESGEEPVDELMVKAAEAMRSGNLAAAESIYDQVIELHPSFSEGWNRRATVRFYRGNFDGSLLDIKETLKLEPRHFGAIWGLGMILGSQQDYRNAIIAFERLLEIKPGAQNIRPRIEMLKEELEKQSI